MKKLLNTVSARRSFMITGMVMTAVLLTGCKSTYYNTWEKLGWAKRDILVDRVKDARDDQEAAKKQFQTTLERFQEITKVTGGDLEVKYKKLNSDYERSQSRAVDVTKRIQSIEEVASDMFTEWRQEITQYQNQELRSASEKKLGDTQAQYRQLIAAMKRAEAKMQPVLAAFKDQVLFLKHNLNAAAVSSLQATTAGIEADVAGLIREMESSIAEANSFISQMK
jgi:hypothetical protein